MKSSPTYELYQDPTQLRTLQNILHFLEKRCLATENRSSPDVKSETMKCAARAVLDSGTQMSLVTNIILENEIYNLQSYSTNVQTLSISDRKSTCNQMFDLNNSSGDNPRKIPDLIVQSWT